MQTFIPRLLICNPKTDHQTTVDGLFSRMQTSKRQLQICIPKCKPSNVLCRFARAIANHQKRFADLFPRMQVSKGGLQTYILRMSANFPIAWPTYAAEDNQRRKDEEFRRNQRKKPD